MRRFMQVLLFQSVVYWLGPKSEVRLHVSCKGSPAEAYWLTAPAGSVCRGDARRYYTGKNTNCEVAIV